MGIDPEVNVTDDVTLYGGKSAFTQLEHNIVAGYLITAGNRNDEQCDCCEFCYSVETSYSESVHLSAVCGLSGVCIQSLFQHAFQNISQLRVKS